MRQKLRADLGAVRQTELLDRLARKYGKYALVVGVAKRAHDLKESAEMHRRIYQAIREGDADRARTEMTRHLDMARQAQASEELPAGVLPSRVVGSVA